MSDLVERLGALALKVARWPLNDGNERRDTADALTESAAEITRLKAEVEGLKKENELLQGEIACHDEEERGWEEDAAKDRARIKELEAALEFYADISKYPAPLTGGMGALWSDCGEVARGALRSREGGANG